MIVPLLPGGGDLVERADVCVIGSGAGGAVVAALLAEAGRSVVLLEQGHHWTAKDFTQREEEMLPRLFEEGGMRMTVDGGINILQGRNVGGSTVHNLCYAFRTPEPILRLWREEHGLPELMPGAVEPSFARVEAGLKVKQIREDEVNRMNQIIRAGAEKLGYSGFVTKHNREGCLKAGYCILGCSYDAKQSMLVTYVPRADRAGARIYANARAERIEAEGGRARRVLGHIVGPGGAAHGALEITAPVIVLAAGSIGSPDVLLRSGLANGSNQVGRNLHLHPAAIATGFFEDVIDSYRGIPQSYYIDQFIDLERDPRAGYMLMPITAFPILTAATLPGFGEAHHALMRDYARTAGLLVLLHDQSSGRVESGGSLSKPRITYNLEDRDARQIAEGLVHCAEVLFAAGARRVLVPYWPEPLILERGDDPAVIARRGAAQGEIVLTSVHPQSTCRMGGDPASSVVNAWGECHDVRGLYVADMSVFPTSLGAPPQITTAMLADRTAHRILDTL
ncbi:MAG: GMC family oxidoreductase [Deltaproteobacteria bacterium]|nr:GMC family oxidoreductase [Deltaproteobacteria bacterium]